MRALIAGCGYVGCRLAELLRDAGHEVWGLRRSVNALPPGIVPVAADLDDVATLRRALEGETFDWLVYATAADGRDEGAYRRAYVEGVRHLLEVVPLPQRIAFTSSTAVYGQSDGAWVTEESPTDPDRFTGEVMLEAEALVATYATTTIAVRFGGIYGPTRTRMIDRVASGQASLPSGPQFTNRIHRDDCAGVLAHLLELDDPASCYIGVDDDPADMGEMLVELARILGRPAPAMSSEDAPAMGKRCSNARLRASGFAFRYPSYREGYHAQAKAMGLVTHGTS